MEENKVAICKTCGKKFLMIKMELDFYAKQGYPKPLECPVCRQNRREAQRPPRMFFKRKCDKCGKDMITVYPDDSGKIVYCLECFRDYYNRVDPLKSALDVDSVKIK